MTEFMAENKPVNKPENKSENKSVNKLVEEKALRLNRECKILIVGTGLIGGSYAMALSRKGYDVSAIDTDAESIAFGLENGFFREGSTEVRPDMLAAADIVVIGLYPTTLLGWLEANQQYFRPGTVITDVSGVKSNIVDKAQGFLRDDIEFCASHPMAGREVSGIRNADWRIFRDANFIITPTDRNTAEGIAVVRALAEDLEFKTIRELDIYAHDCMIGFLSQLTHAIAVSLMTCNDDDELAAFTGDSFRDLTRIARINDEMWSELFLLNRDILMENIDRFAAELGRLRGMLEQNDRDGLRQMFRKSTERRRQFDAGK